jgi:hypothetical protein
VEVPEVGVGWCGDALPSNDVRRRVAIPHEVTASGISLHDVFFEIEKRFVVLIVAAAISDALLNEGPAFHRCRSLGDRIARHFACRPHLGPQQRFIAHGFHAVGSRGAA